MNRDFKELLQEFNAKGVEYLIVGAHAMAAYGHIRATKDLDVWVRPSAHNSSCIMHALKEFGAPLLGISESDLSTPGVVFQIGVAPIRIDILTSIDGVDFEEAWTERIQTRFSGVPTSIIARHHLIQNKKSSGRMQDLADIEHLQAEDAEEEPN